MSKLDYEQLARRHRCESDHLYFSRYFFQARQGIKFRVNWHHQLISAAIDKVIRGDTKNLVINVPPGSSKTELVSINLMARGLAINPRARFLHLSYSDDLAALNSKTARDIVLSDEFQRLWPMKIADDSNSKKRWNVEDSEGNPLGGVYATSLGGQVTGFRAGHMTDGFTGAIIIDDPLKPEDAFSKAKLAAANRKLLTTVKSRRANPDIPIIIIMQRISEDDPVGFIESGNIPGEWEHVVIPALIDEHYVKDKIPEDYHDLVDRSSRDALSGRFSYWPYKEPLEELLAMERGDGADSDGSRISRHVFSSQYQQKPVALGGNILHGSHFKRFKLLPKMQYRKIFADTAQKTKERNDYSVFECWGYAEGRIYLIDLIRGKWEAPELQKRAIAFWRKHAAADVSQLGQLRKMVVEDKSSGTGLVQTIRLSNQIPIEGLERNKDKLTRAMDALPYIESGCVWVPEDADFTSDFITECEAFTSDDSHKHDDQVDPLFDAVEDMLSSNNKLRLWEKSAE